MGVVWILMQPIKMLGRNLWCTKPPIQAGKREKLKCRSLSLTRNWKSYLLNFSLISFCFVLLSKRLTIYSLPKKIKDETVGKIYFVVNHSEKIMECQCFSYLLCLVVILTRDQKKTTAFYIKIKRWFNLMGISNKWYLNLSLMGSFANYMGGLFKRRSPKLDVV